VNVCGSLSGDIDVTHLCDGPSLTERLSTGPAVLVIEVVKGLSVGGYIEAVVANNRFEIPAVAVSCHNGESHQAVFLLKQINIYSSV